MMVRYFSRLALVACLLALQGLFYGPTAAKAVAQFTWRMEPRYQKSWAASGATSYDPAYVNPDHWQVTLDACGSTAPGSKILGYGWHIQAKDFDYTFPGHKDVSNTVATDRGNQPSYYASDGCKWDVRLPRLGAYEVQLVVETDQHETSTHAGTIKLQDLLYVSIGDSMSSGEGNPDQPGEYKLDKLLWTIDYPLGDTQVIRLAEWKNRLCHRSALSGPALAAQTLENRVPHASITFLSFACSGAEIRHLTNDSYAGREPNYVDPRRNVTVRDHRLQKPQLQAVKQVIGNRKIDALILSVGINDLYFSDMMMDCATNKHLSFEVFDDPSCVNKSADQLGKLPARYDALAKAIASQLNVAKVYIAEYPYNVLAGNGCGWLKGVRNDEVGRIRKVGSQLNDIIRAAAQRHGWTVIRSRDAKSIVDVFQGHDYCASNPYFVGLEESVKVQGPKHGALHPNAKGHQAFGALIVDTLSAP